jgi:2-polyprenyl-3-methyl-5-hydroxy-6-metoxy-1,4-benzoquinol methylase
VPRALLLFPANVHLARRLLDYAAEELRGYELDALTLASQAGVEALLADAPFARRFRLAGPFYGRLAGDDDVRALEEAAGRGYRLAVFPTSAFNGNGFLLGACLAPVVRCVNPFADGGGHLVVDVPGRGAELAQPAPGYPAAGWDEQALADVLARLAEMRGPLELLAAESGDERPTGGLVRGYPHDLEVFVRYLWAARASGGRRVLGVGSGLGYGAAVLAREAAEVVAVEPDGASVEFARTAWQPLSAGRLSFVQGTSATLDGLGTFDRVVCFEVLEHVEDPAAMLRALAAALAPGGLLLASTPDPRRFLFRVNRERDLDSSVEELQARGIWKWHLAGIAPGDAVAAALRAGFDSAQVLGSTYVAGPAHLAAVRAAPDVRAAVAAVDASTAWRLDDFDVTAERSPAFSGFSYLLAARRAL